MNQNLDDILSSISKNPQMLSKALDMAKGLANAGVLQGLLKSDGEALRSEGENPEGKDSKDKSVEGKSSEDLPVPYLDLESKASRDATMQQKIDLLCAIKPFLSPERQKSLDSILHILKLAGPLLSASKLLK